MSTFDGEEDFTAETAHELAQPSTAWRVGDRVRVIDGPRMLIGATGTVVEDDVPGFWPVRVCIDRGGFDRALLAAHELESASEVTS